MTETKYITLTLNPKLD